ncbi:MAG: formate dehydrogenase subunit delta [Hyphomicrobiales bacterium]
MSDVSELVRMANQIADFFGPYPEDETIAGVTQHIRDFWTPAMRKQMAEHLAAGGAGLRPLALKALNQMQPAPAGA